MPASLSFNFLNISRIPKQILDYKHRSDASKVQWEGPIPNLKMEKIVRVTSFNFNSNPEDVVRTQFCSDSSKATF